MSTINILGYIRPKKPGKRKDTYCSTNSKDDSNSVKGGIVGGVMSRTVGGVIHGVRMP
jgi:hypothetical protein